MRWDRRVACDPRRPNGDSAHPATHFSPGQWVQVLRRKPAPSHPCWLKLRPWGAGDQTGTMLPPPANASLSGLRGAGLAGSVREMCVWILWARGIDFLKGQRVNILGFSCLKAKWKILCSYLYNKRENKCPHTFILLMKSKL